MKLTKRILTAAMMAGTALAQNPNIINNTQNKMNAVEQQKTNDSNAALGLSSSSAAAKPTAGAPSSAVKPASTSAAKAMAPAAMASGANNKLERVNVVRHADEVQIELAAHDAVSPRVSKMTSPDRLVLEFPGTSMATAQNKISVGSAGVKGVRIGTDGKTPPTTSVVVDLEQAHGYELTPGPANKFVLTLHSQAAAKSTPPPTSAKPASAPKLQAAAAKPSAVPVPAPKVATKTVALATTSTASKTFATTVAVSSPAPSKVVAAATSAPKNVSVAAGKITASAPPTAPAKAAGEKPASDAAAAGASKTPKPEEKKWAMNGKRDPFFSPVVQQSTGSGCSSGKKCLEIGQINLRGVVKAEAGFIAVVTNSQDKAYFLHENDPVFNGYVVRITGDSVVFEETVQDKLGKSLKREVTKKITTPAV